MASTFLLIDSYGNIMEFDHELPRNEWAVKTILMSLSKANKELSKDEINKYISDYIDRKGILDGKLEKTKDPVRSVPEIDKLSIEFSNKGWRPPTNKELMTKINEIIDTVNKLGEK